MKRENYFPHRSDELVPERRFLIDDRWLNLYWEGKKSGLFRLYWQNEQAPVITEALFQEVIVLMSAFLSKENNKKEVAFPHTQMHPKTMRPIARFSIAGRWLNLYSVTGRPPSHPYSFYWQNENNPVQHAMTITEVFVVLAQCLGGDD